MSIPDHHIWFAESQEPEGPYLTRLLIDKPLADSQRSTHRLVLSIEPSRLRYVLLSPQGEWIKAKSIESTGLLSQENFLRFLLEKEKILGESFVEIQVYISESAFFLVPDALHESRYDAALGRLLIDEQLFEDELHQIPLNFMDAQLFINFEPIMKHILDHYIRDYQLLHPISTVLSVGHRQASEKLEAYILFEGNRVLIGLFEAGKLLFSNSFLCRTEVDVLYYLQLVRQICGLDEQHLTARYMGEYRWVAAISWEAYGIHWEEAKLTEEVDPDIQDRQDLTSWRYLVV